MVFLPHFIILVPWSGSMTRRSRVGPSATGEMGSRQCLSGPKTLGAAPRGPIPAWTGAKSDAKEPYDHVAQRQSEGL